ncbi:hypothetical protein T492DRAFT_157202 [Pavlovales sp. CCMP2436]|nr:hypothetical protein T492DRAFT_157202 [Pavlovales sp. CCMP2436]
MHLRSARRACARRRTAGEGGGESPPLTPFIPISRFSRCRAVRGMVDRMWSGKLRPDDGTYAALVRAHVHWGEIGRAVRVLHRMQTAGMEMRRRTVQPLVKKLCADGQARAAVRVWQRTEQLGAVFTSADFADLLDACCRVGELGYILPILARLRDDCDERLPEGVLALLETALASARTTAGEVAFAVSRVQIDPASEKGCSHCGTVLHQLRLDEEQRASVAERLLQVKKKKKKKKLFFFFFFLNFAASVAVV